MKKVISGEGGRLQYHLSKLDSVGATFSIGLSDET